MDVRTRRVWAAALLAVAVMALSPSRAVAEELEPGELKAITEGTATTPVVEGGELKALMESFSTGGATVMEPGELKAIMEAPARYAVLDAVELKALMESGTRPIKTDEGTTSASSGGVDWTAAGVATLALLFLVGVGVVLTRRRDRIAPA